MNALIILTFLTASQAYPFKDVSTSVGLHRRTPLKKYGGPVVADFDGDGWPDILIGHHDQSSADLYFNMQNGTFARAGWKFWRDSHSFVPFHATPRSRGMHFYVSTGGNFGRKPTAPTLFSVSPSRNVRKVSTAFFAKGRGRVIIPVSLFQKLWWPTFMFLNAVPDDDTTQNYAGSLISGRTAKKADIKGFNTKNSYGTVTDINNDGTMEIVSFHTLKIHKVIGSFKLRDVSNYALPKDLDLRGVVSVSEFDYDNDGRMDLYIARSATNDIDWMVSLIGKEPNDYLLRNVGGRYVDATKVANIPSGGESRGVTCGDFDNDGNIDLLVTKFKGPDVLLMNNGDGTFSARRTGYGKSGNTRGDQPVAVDYDRDGRVDLVLAEGAFNDKRFGGFLRVIRNMNGIDNKWLLVQVGSALMMGTSSLHALVTVSLGSGKKMSRRVGSPGTATGASNIELLHFGLGQWVGSVRVMVRWRDGSSRQVVTTPNQLIKVGKIIN